MAIRFTKIANAVAKCKDSENSQVLLLRIGQVVRRESRVESQQRQQNEPDETSDDPLQQNV